MLQMVGFASLSGHRDVAKMPISLRRPVTSNSRIPSCRRGCGLGLLVGAACAVQADMTLWSAGLCMFTGFSPDVNSMLHQRMQSHRRLATMEAQWPRVAIMLVICVLDGGENDVVRHARTIPATGRAVPPPPPPPPPALPSSPPALPFSPSLQQQQVHGCISNEVCSSDWWADWRHSRRPLPTHE